MVDTPQNCLTKELGRIQEFHLKLKEKNLFFLFTKFAYEHRYMFIELYISIGKHMWNIF